MKPLRPLLLTASVAALITASPVLAQEAQPVPPPEPVQVPLIRIAPPEEQPAGDGQVEEPAVEGEDGEPADTELPPEPVVAIPEVWAPVPTDEEGRSAYGLYLAARAALASGDTQQGAVLLQQANRLTPEQPRLREQAFTAAILAGDLKFAAEIVPTDPGVSPTITEAGQLIRGIETYLDEGARKANRLLAQRPVEMPHDRAATYAQVWIAAEAGDWTRALAAPPADFDPISALVARSNRARLLEIRRRYDEAEAEWKELTAHAVAGALFRLGYGEFLERRRRGDEALALYTAAIEAGQAEPRIYLAHQRVTNKGRPPATLRFREGVAMSLRTAADQMVAQNANEFAAVYLRLAQQISPSAQTQAYIGQTLINGNLAGAGRAVLAEIQPDQGPLYATARAQRGMSFEKSGMDEEALAEFKLAVAASPQDPAIVYALANMLIQMERYDEALEVLNGPVLNTVDQGFEVRFMRGAALEAVGRRSEAEGELNAALTLQPNDPGTLNYLGYLWVESGERVAEGMALIQRALASDPEDGHFLDSLGWGYFMSGQPQDALESIEKAVAKEPANAEINDHLGDVYWALGRHKEAGFQWQRVLTLEVDSKRRAEVEAKLKERLNQLPYAMANATAATEAP